MTPRAILGENAPDFLCITGPRYCYVDLSGYGAEPDPVKQAAKEAEALARQEARDQKAREQAYERATREAERQKRSAEYREALSRRRQELLEEARARKNRTPEERHALRLQAGAKCRETYYAKHPEKRPKPKVKPEGRVRLFEAIDIIGPPASQSAASKAIKQGYLSVVYVGRQAYVDPREVQRYFATSKERSLITRRDNMAKARACKKGAA